MQPVQSVERALGILSIFSPERPSLPAGDIAELTGLPRSTVYRLLATLVELGFVANANGRYELTHRVLEIGAGYRGPSGLALQAQQALDKLAAEIDEHVGLAIMTDGHVVTIATASPIRAQLLAVAVQVGQELPADKASMGHIFLAEQGLLGDRGLQIRRKGYAITDGTLDPGLRAISVPVLGHEGQVIAALGVACVASRTSVKDLRQRILPLARVTAADLTTSLLRI